MSAKRRAPTTIGPARTTQSATLIRRARPARRRLSAIWTPVGVLAFARVRPGRPVHGAPFRARTRLDAAAEPLPAAPSLALQALAMRLWRVEMHEPRLLAADGHRGTAVDDPGDTLCQGCGGDEQQLRGGVRRASKRRADDAGGCQPDGIPGLWPSASNTTRSTTRTPPVGRCVTAPSVKRPTIEDAAPNSATLQASPALSGGSVIEH